MKYEYYKVIYNNFGTFNRIYKMNVKSGILYSYNNKRWSKSWCKNINDVCILSSKHGSVKPKILILSESEAFLEML